MPKILLLSVLLLAFATSGALASSGTKASASTGRISAVGTTSVTVHGVRCKVGAASPKLTAFKVGARVRIVCKDGVLRAIAKQSALKQLDDSPVATTPAVGGSGRISAISTVGTGSLSILGRFGDSATGDTSVTCGFDASSPGIGDYHVGDYVHVRCENGALRAIAKIEKSPPPTTTPPVSTNVGGSGKVSGVSTSSISFLGRFTDAATGDTSLTCALDAHSPGIGDYRVGDYVKVRCENGLLRTISRIESTPPATTPPATTPTTTTVSRSKGGITALGDDSISVYGDRASTCSIDADSPSLDGYAIGDKVQIGCTDWVLRTIAHL